MRIDCDSCSAAFTIDDQLIGDKGIRAQCPKCGHQTVVKQDGGAAAAPDSAPASASVPSSANPFAAPAGGNPFAAPAAPPPAAPAAGNPFGTAPAAPPAGDNPFGAPSNAAAPSNAGPPAAGNPFAAPEAQGADPFGGAPAGGNPFATTPAPNGGNPFAAAPVEPAAAPANALGDGPGQNPFAAAAPSPAAAGNPFGTAPTAPAGNPFAAPAGSPPAGNAPTGNAPPSGDPFANPSAGGNPFGAPPEPSSAESPFGTAPAPAGGDPFGAGGSTPEAPSGDPFASPATSNPFGTAPAAPTGDQDAEADPFADLGGPGGDDPFSADGGEDPFANLDAGGAQTHAQGDGDPFADISGAPGAGTNDGVETAGPSNSLWQVETSGGKSTDVTLDDLRQMIRSGQVGGGDQAGPMGRPMKRVSADAILAISLPKGTSSGQARVSGAAARGGGGGIGKALLMLLIIGGLGGGGAFLYQTRPDLFEGAAGNVNPFRRALPQWGLQFPNVEGTSREHVVEGRKYLRMDTAITYRRAEEHFRQALLLDVANADAIAGYVEAYSYLPNVSASADRAGIRLAFQGVEFALQDAPNDVNLLRAHGALLLVSGRVDDAGRVLSRAVKTDAGNMGAKLLLARATLDRSVTSSLAIVEVVQRTEPELRQALTIGGAAHRRLGNYSRARDFLSSRLQGDPGNVDALRELALLELDLGAPSRALKWLQRIGAAEERDVGARLLLAKTYYQFLGKNSLAEKELKFVIDNYEGAAGDLLLPVLSHYAYLLILRGDVAGAEKATKRALEIDPTYAPAHVILARALATKTKDAKKLEAARKALEEALRLVKSSSKGEAFYEPVVRTQLADIQMRLGDTGNAERNYLEVLKYDPRFAAAYFGLAAAYAQQGRAAQAVGRVREALKVDPRHGASRTTLTDFPTPRQDLLVYARALSRMTSDGVGKSLKYSAEGVARFHAGDRARANALFQKALTSDGANHAALLYLAVEEIEKGAARKASRRLNKALKTTAGAHTITLLYLAEAEIALGKYNSAQKRLTAIIDDDPSIARAHFVLAELALRRGKRDEGIRQLKKIVTDYPLYRPAKTKLAKLGA